MRVVTAQILNATDSASHNGSAIDTNQWFQASFQTITGDATATGTVKIQGSNDNPDGTQRNLFIPTNWSDIPNATSSIASGVGPMIVIQTMAYQYIRAVYTSASGGSSTITVQANGLSA